MRRCTPLLSALLLLASCLRGGQERAELDRTVGLASAQGIQISVEGGLASVRHIEAGAAELWLSAPSQRLTFTAGDTAPMTWALRLLNAMPGLTATCDAPPGLTCTALALPGERPTVTDLTLTLDGPGQYSLTLTPPGADDDTPFSVALLSDIQEELPRVQDIYDRINALPEVRYVVSAGDLTDHGDEATLIEFQRAMQGLNVPLYATCGNHDIMDGSFGDWSRLFGRHSFHFTYGQVAFTFMDSASATIDPIAYGWLEEWLEEASDSLHVFVTHYPIIDPDGYRNGSLRSRQESHKLLAMLAKGGVDLTLYGHVHTYLTFTNAGIDAIISGGGGGWPERLDGIGRHFVVLTLDPSDSTISRELVQVD